MLLPSKLFGYGDERFRVTYGKRSTARTLRMWEGRCL
jgi:hypothetical protein